MSAVRAPQSKPPKIAWRTESASMRAMMSTAKTAGRPFRTVRKRAEP
jgi:hypothetical protein